MNPSMLDLIGRQQRYAQMGRQAPNSNRQAQIGQYGPMAALPAAPGSFQLGGPQFPINGWNGLADGSCFGPPVQPIPVQQFPPVTTVVPRCPTDDVIEILGLGDECLGPCETREISIIPPFLYLLKRLVFDPSCAFAISVIQINVGIFPLIANCRCVAGTLFLPDAITPVLKPITGQPAIPLCLTIKNHSNAKVCVRGGFFCKAIV